MHNRILAAAALCLWAPAAVRAQVSPMPNSWTMGTPMPTARSGPFTGVIGSKIYVVGGLTTSGSILNVNEIYDTTTNTWSTGAPMPTARYIGASAVVGNILYAIGGQSNGLLNVVEAYDPSTNTWSTKAAVPIVVNSVYAVSLNNIIYLIGGYNNSGGRLTTVLSYNPVTNVWSTLAPLNVGKSLSAVGVLGSTIVSAGGLANPFAITADTEGYNAASNSWTTLPPIPTARQGSCFGVSGGLFYVAGGNQSGTEPITLNVLEAYDPAANSWTSGLPAMPIAVGAQGSATVGGRLYCFGGGDASGTHNYVQIYQPAVPVSITSVISSSRYGGSTSIAPGSWIEIHGSMLAADTRAANPNDFNDPNAPTSLDGTSLTIGGQAAFLNFISPTQINAQVPSGVGPGPQQVIVTTAQGNSNSYTVTVNATQPALLAPLSLAGGNQYVPAWFESQAPILIPGDPTTAFAHRPIPGDTIIMYGIGFGSVTPDSPAGQIVQQDNTLVTPLQVFFGGVQATNVTAGLAVGNMGIYQINVTVPAIAASDTVPLTFTLGGTAGTQTLFIAVEN